MTNCKYCGLPNPENNPFCFCPQNHQEVDAPPMMRSDITPPNAEHLKSRREAYMVVARDFERTIRDLYLNAYRCADALADEVERLQAENDRLTAELKGKP